MAHLPDYPITRLPDYPITRLPDYPITRLPDYPITRLPDYPITRLPDYPILAARRSGGRRPQVLVPLQIRRRRADADDVDALVAVEIADDAAGGGHRALIEHLMLPLAVRIARRVHDVDAGALRVAIA